MIAQKETFEQISDWLLRMHHPVSTKLRLIGIPHAIGNALFFRSWSSYVDPTIEMIGVTLPGHGNRMGEAPYQSLSQLITALCDAIQPYLDKPFALYGHSMGGLLTYELTQELIRRDCRLPSHLFISGYNAPHIPHEEADRYHHLAPDALRQKLKALGGIPEVVLNDTDLFEFLIPTIRADFSICENYEYQHRPPMEIPISVFNGIDDTSVSLMGIKDWRKYTSSYFESYFFKGEHFFVQDELPQILEIINERLLEHR